MSTATEPFRFPTLTYVDERTGRDMNSRIPVYPQPSIFETIEIERIPGSGVFFDHVTVEKVMARPPWSFAEAMARFDREDWLRKVEAETVKPRKAGKTAKAAKSDRTKKRPTPKRPR